MRKYLVAFDTAAARIVGKIPASVRPFFHILGTLTMPVVWCGVLAALAVFRLLPTSSLLETLLVVAIVPVGSLLKYIIHRKRPPTIYANHMKIKTPSFPSSHAYASLVSLGYLMILMVEVSAYILVLPTALLVIMIGISRVHLGAHYPSDVVGGWLIGSLLLAIIIFMPK